MLPCTNKYLFSVLSFIVLQTSRVIQWPSTSTHPTTQQHIPDHMSFYLHFLAYRNKFIYIHEMFKCQWTTVNKSSYNCVFNFVRFTTATQTVHTHKTKQKKPTQQLTGEPTNMQTPTSSLSHKKVILDNKGTKYLLHKIYTRFPDQTVEYHYQLITHSSTSTCHPSPCRSSCLCCLTSSTWTWWHRAQLPE